MPTYYIETKTKGLGKTYHNCQVKLLYSGKLSTWRRNKIFQWKKIDKFKAIKPTLQLILERRVNTPNMIYSINK